MTTSASPWRIEEGFEAHLPAIRALYARVRGNNRPEDFDRWRYFGGPYGPCPMALAMAGEHCVGLYTVWPAMLAIGGAEMLGAQSMDTMTDPDWQGRGIFTALARACFDMAAARGFRILYGFPNPLSYPGFVRKLGWTHTGDVPQWIRPLQPSRHPRLSGALGVLADGVAALWPKGGRGDFETVSAPVEASVLSVMAGASGGICRLARRTEWLEWRYAAVSGRRYQGVQARRGGRTRAMAVWGMADGAWGSGRAQLVELWGEDAARTAALAVAIDGARKAGAWLFETMTNQPEARRSLRRAGFVTHRKAPFIVRTLGDDVGAADVLAHENWHIVGGDVDTF
jgi:GNAT superfamily N-acetyltransferase